MKKDAPPPTDAAAAPADIMAYKQCVSQLKRERASNPYTQCKARLKAGANTNKSEDKKVEKDGQATAPTLGSMIGYPGAPPTAPVTKMEMGMSYSSLKKKEMKIPKVSAPNPHEIAPTIHAKKKKQVAYKAQIDKVTPDPVPEHVKKLKSQLAMKKDEGTGLFPGMSFAQLQKMQTEEELRKPKK